LNQDLQVVKASELQPGDIVLVNTGDRLPADGKIIHGDIELDESMLTGESEPVFKKKGADVFSGSILKSGNATIKVEKTGDESTIGQIINLVKTSRADKPSVQKLADRISNVFVPAILIIALSTFLINWLLVDVGVAESVIRSVAVLVIACPCAMGLATPTAVSVGLGLAGKIGIIIKKASSFEELNAVEHFIFDKTGTLTQGDLQLVLNSVNSDFSQEEVWRIIKALEERSTHPIAEAVLSLTEHLNIAVLDQIKEIPGGGMQGLLKSKEVKFGTGKFTLQKDQESDLFLTLDHKVIATFNVTDKLKSDAGKIIASIQKSGNQVSILSGDNERKTKQVAEALHVNNYHAHQLPQQKLDYIGKAKSKLKVAMIGDGINDAPSLSAADVGISMGTANALAAESAKVVILGSSMEQLGNLLKISERVVTTIKQNLFWAFAYNLVAIPLAAMGYLDPMVAALSMAFSDVIVIGNSLRLRFVLPQSIR
jgi:Cu+-exporting ATPase